MYCLDAPITLYCKLQSFCCIFGSSELLDKFESVMLLSLLIILDIFLLCQLKFQMEYISMIVLDSFHVLFNFIHHFPGGFHNSPKQRSDGVVVRRVLSANRNKVNALQNLILELQNENEQLRLENRDLKRSSRIQEKAIKKYDNEEAEIPLIIQKHNSEVCHSECKNFIHKSSPCFSHFHSFIHLYSCFSTLPL